MDRFYSEYYGCGYYTDIVDGEKKLDLSVENPSQHLTITEVIDLLNRYDKVNEKQTIELCKLLEENSKLRRINRKLME